MGGMDCCGVYPGHHAGCPNARSVVTVPVTMEPRPVTADVQRELPPMGDRLPNRAPGWWCWRCGWWQTEIPGRYQPDHCVECASWSRERRLPTDTLVRALVTVEMPS